MGFVMRQYLLQFWIVSSFLIFITSFLSSCDKAPPEPVKIGLAINLSGWGGAAGEHIRDGAMLAVREVNDSGGIHGRPLKLIVQDDENNAATIKRVDQALIDQGVVAIFGHSYSSNTITAYPLVTSQQTLLVTAYTATNELSGRDDFFLRTSVDCVLYGKKTAILLRDKGVKSLAVLMDMSNEGFVLDYVDVLKKHFPGRLVEVGFTSREHVDWQQVVSDLLSKTPDGVLMLTEAGMTGVAAQKLRLAGYDGPFIASVWAQTPTLFDYGGEAVEGMSLVSYIDPQNRHPAYLAFAEKMKETFRKEATARSVRAYEMIMILSDALKRCDGISAAELKRALLDKEYDTLMGHVAFDANGDVIRPVFEIKVSGAHFQRSREL